MAFEPISGTIGALAFGDTMFSRCAWVYQKYRLSEDFGSDYLEYTIKYRSEVFRFNEMINHSHTNLRESALDVDQRRLKDPLRGRLLLWMSDLKRCEDLIAQCEKGLLPGGDVMENDPADQASLEVAHGTQSSEPCSPSVALPSALNSLASSTVCLTESGGQTTPSLAIVSLATLVTDAVKVPFIRWQIQHDRERKRDRFRRALPYGHRKRSPRPAIRSPSPVEENMPIADQQSLARSPQQRHEPPIESSLLPAAALAQVELTDRASEVYGRSELSRRVGWVAKSRSDFITLLEKLTEHANFFNSMMQLDQSKRMIFKLRKAEELKSKVDKYRDLGDRLGMLLQSLNGLTGSNQAEVQLMLHNDPLSLHSKFRTGSRLLSFRPGSAAFYMRFLSSAPKNIRQDAIPGRGLEGPELQLTSPRYLVFDVHHASASSPATASTVSSTALPSISGLFDDKIEPDRGSGWVRELGHIKAASATGGSISVFSDSTEHTEKVTLADSLGDEREQRFFQPPSQASSRVRLALVLTCSLIYGQIADGARALNSKELVYYATEPTNDQAADLRHSRINPFIRLQMVGLPTTMGTSHMVLTSAARDEDDEKTGMVRSLGILLYEIGTWAVSVGTTVPEKVSFVRRKKGILAGEISVLYHDAVNSCLGVRKDELGNMEEWMVENVAEPLQQVLDDIERLRLIA